MELNLIGKKVLVTGGSRGIGKAIVQNMVDEGAVVATCARGEKALMASIADWQEQGGNVYGGAVDVSDTEAFSQWFESSVEQMGGLDILVSNVTSLIDTQGVQRWQDMFENDLLQHIRTTEMALKYLPKGGDSSIVYIASIASVMSANMPSEVEYGAMKAALVSYASQLANRLGKDNIRVNMVSPGPIQHPNGFWEMVEKQNPELHKRACAFSVFNRLGKSTEVANAVTFLASPAASFITGSNLRIDGGAIKTVNF